MCVFSAIYIVYLGVVFFLGVSLYKCQAGPSPSHSNLCIWVQISVVRVELASIWPCVIAIGRGIIVNSFGRWATFRSIFFVFVWTTAWLAESSKSPDHPMVQSVFVHSAWCYNVELLCRYFFWYQLNILFFNSQIYKSLFASMTPYLQVWKPYLQVWKPYLQVSDL